LQKSFPLLVQLELPPEIGISAIILFAVYRPNLFKITSKQWKVVIPYGLCLRAMNLIFYLIERIPIGLGDTGIYRPIGRCFLAQRFVDYLWVLLAAAGMF
jgi:inner membrane transporter RhtA